MAATVSMPDLPSFRVVPPDSRLRVEDFKLPDGTPMVGADGFLVPSARSFSMVVNAATRVFSYRFDEAMRDNFVNARAMRRDAFIRGLMEERILPTINRKWQLDIDDDTDNNQRYVRDTLTRLVESIPDFDAFKRALLDGTWFGRAGTQWTFDRNPEVDDYWALPKWDPIHGDSVQFTYDGIPAILLDTMTTGWYSQHGATWGPNGDLRPTDRGGTALVLHRPFWRDRFAIHRHIMEKADFLEGELAGSVQGLGLRGLVYWAYVVRTNALTWMLAYMQSVGQMDLLIFNYPQGNAAAEAQQKANARAVIGKAALVCPRNPNQNWQAIEQISMNAAGLEALHKLVSEYFDRHIERLIVGQSMSSGADNKSGLGGTGRADFAKATKDEILVYDTGRLDETLTKDLIGKLKKYNFPWAKFPVRFKSILPDLEAKEKVKNAESLIKNKVLIKVDEFRDAAGFTRPEDGDETVELPPDPNQQQPGGMPGMPPPGGGAPPGAPPLPPGGPSPGGAPPVQPPANAPPTPNAAPQWSDIPRTGRPALPPGPARPPIRNDAGGGMAGGGGFGYPGGSNTYLPKFHSGQIGFTRYGAAYYAATPRKYGCVMLELTGEPMFAMAQLATDVPDRDLAPDGRENKPHVTVRFGLHDNVTPERVADVVRNFGPIRFRLGKMGYFENEEHDVLYINVLSPDLHELHARLGALPNTQTHAEYKPHATIAYVKKGFGKYYRGKIAPLNLDGVADCVIYSDANRNTIPLPTALAGGDVLLADTIAAMSPDELARAVGDSPAHYAAVDYADATRSEGEVWQGDSGRWFTKRGGRVVPAKNPGGGQSAPTAAPTQPAAPVAQTPMIPTVPPIIPPVASPAETQTPPAAPAPQTTAGPTDADFASAPRTPIKTSNMVGAAGVTAGSTDDLFTVDIGGQKYAVKSVNKNGPVGGIKAAERERAEVLSGELATAAGVNIPPARAIPIDGRPYIATPWVDGKPLSEMDATSALRALPPGTAERMALFDYATGFTDNHLGNYLIGSDGSLHGIDREAGLGVEPAGGEEMAFFMDESPFLRALAGPVDTGPRMRQIPLDPKTVAQMATVAATIPGKLSGRPAAEASQRAAVLARLAQMSNPTIGDLMRLSESAPAVRNAAAGTPTRYEHAATPPFPGGVFDESRHRWVKPENAHGAAPDNTPDAAAPEPAATGDDAPVEPDVDDSLVDMIDADLAAMPELQNAKPGTVDKIRQMASAAVDRAQWLLWEVTLRTPQILSAWTDIFDHPDDLGKIGYNAGFSGVAGHRTGDPITSTLGFSSTHQLAGLACKLGGTLIAWAKRKVKGQSKVRQRKEFEAWARAKYGPEGFAAAKQWVGDTSSASANAEFWQQHGHKYAADTADENAMASAVLLKRLMDTIYTAMGLKPESLTVEQIAQRMAQLRADRAAPPG